MNFVSPSKQRKAQITKTNTVKFVNILNNSNSFKNVSYRLTLRIPKLCELVNSNNTRFCLNF